MPEIVPEDESLKSLEGLHLWHAPMSSCSQRVRIVLAETGVEFESHLVNLEKDEHASAAYQAIHPDGLVPALVDNGHLYIESIDIIQHLTREDAGFSAQEKNPIGVDCLKLADDSQADLKLLTFEFLRRSRKPSSESAVSSFQSFHKNEWLKQFRLDFDKGFGKDRIDASVNRTEAGLVFLDNRLSDGRDFLDGDSFSVSDVAWMPNLHRLSLMDWPVDQTPYLKKWLARIAQRPSFTDALLAWQPEELDDLYAGYTEKRRALGTDVRSFGNLQRY